MERAAVSLTLNISEINQASLENEWHGPMEFYGIELFNEISWVSVRT